MPIADVIAQSGDADGFEATAKTVSRGNTIDEFPVTVLGVLKDGIAVGHDMIIVNVHDYPAMDDPQHGPHGIWAGMSGSPVYAANGDLIGCSTTRRRPRSRRALRPPCSGRWSPRAP
jgi:hypothetical protein